jgi:RNA polymerase sigma-70 factor (ECF subfamily)
MMPESQLIPNGASRQDELYQQAASDYGAALHRLARAYENDPERRRDLLQEIHLALWQSFARFDGRCSLRTWVYRVAHNVATSHVIRDRRASARVFVGLAALEATSGEDRGELAIDRSRALERLLLLIHRLGPPDRQVILLYLEGMDAASIGEITGLSSGNVATRVHRIKNILARRFFVEGRCGE